MDKSRALTEFMSPELLEYIDISRNSEWKVNFDPIDQYIPPQFRDNMPEFFKQLQKIMIISYPESGGGDGLEEGEEDAKDEEPSKKK